MSGIVIVTNLKLQLVHSPLQFDQLHVKSSLLSLECGNLLLNPCILCLLMSVVPLHLFLNFE